MTYTIVMRNRILIVLSVIAVVAVLFLVINRGDQPDISPGQSVETMTPQPTVDAESKGSYVEYSESMLAAASGTRILFFHASWCPQCRALEADIMKSGIPSGTTIFKVDYDNAQDLRKKYGVTLQTTVVKVDESGKLISKFTPYQKPTLQNALENL